MKLLVSVLLLFVSIISYSQDEDEMFSKEFGFSVGAMYGNTDIEGLAMDFKNFKPSGGLYAAVIYRQKVGLRLEGTSGAITASDTRAYDYRLRYRNLSFTSKINELSLLAEVHPMNIFVKQDNAPALSPYILAGVGYFEFNPKTQLDGKWVYLQPLHTEGEGFPGTGRPNYKLAAMSIPVGGGLQYKLSDRLVLRGEFVYRYLNTDYVDDVSTTYIDPALFDVYLTPENAALARRLSDRSYELTDGSTHRPGTIRGSQKKDSYYTVNLKLGIQLFKSAGYTNVDYHYRIRKRGHGCYSFK